MNNTSIFNLLLCSKQEFEQAQYCDKLPMKCSICGSIKNRFKRHIIHALRDKRTNYVCSPTCKGILNKTGKITQCSQCKKTIYKQSNELKNSKHCFCNSSCAATYHNTHKDFGYRRSKLELFIEQQLKKDFPNLNISFNDNKTIGSELDIYIPALRLAFELNGIFHYEPIYSHDQFTRIQNNDKRKLIECYSHGIELVVIDTSKQTRFTDVSSQKYYSIIKDIIQLNIGRL